VAIADGAGLSHLLEVDGTSCGYAMSVEGGWGIADISEESSPTGIKKRPGPPRWEELELRLALPVARPVFDWIAAAWRREVQAKDLLVTTVDLEGNVLRRREFRNALLTATTIAMEPPAPGSSVTRSWHGFVTLRLLPQAARTTSPTATVAAPTRPSLRPLLYRLELSGLDCAYAGPVDAFTVQQTFGNPIPPSPGLRVWLEPGPLSFPNLTVTLAKSSARDWQRWFENFIVKGYNDATNEKTGTLALEDPQGKGLARIGLFNVGIFHLKGPILSAMPGESIISQVTVAELYCERMELTLP
jgi:hypothetical protein